MRCRQLRYIFYCSLFLSDHSEHRLQCVQNYTTAFLLLFLQLCCSLNQQQNFEYSILSLKNLIAHKYILLQESFQCFQLFVLPKHQNSNNTRLFLLVLFVAIEQKRDLKTKLLIIMLKIFSFFPFSCKIIKK